MVAQPQLWLCPIVANSGLGIISQALSDVIINFTIASFCWLFEIILNPEHYLVIGTKQFYVLYWCICTIIYYSESVCESDPLFRFGVTALRLVRFAKVAKRRNFASGNKIEKNRENGRADHEKVNSIIRNGSK